MRVPQIIICKCIHQSIDLTIETHGDLRSREATRQAEKPTSREAEKPPDKPRSREAEKPQGKPRSQQAEKPRSHRTSREAEKGSNPPPRLNNTLTGILTSKACLSKKSNAPTPLSNKLHRFLTSQLFFLRDQTRHPL